ncbi:MAG: glycosyltransferase family 4 protein [Oscillospiraceae bacterium]|nr:glycosyltransferase family 4 protein [Oscillospiraceae bacterium]
MNILFLTLIEVKTHDQRGIYNDLIRQFAAQGHDTYIVSPAERRHEISTHLMPDVTQEPLNRIHILRVKTGNITKTNMIEKGVSTVLLESQIKAAVKKYLGHVKFDLVLYSTPPITLTGPIAYVKKRDNAQTYLLLKDIFPQNAVDIGMMQKTGLKGMLYKFFRAKEKKLYALSDRIGCMSDANVKFLLRENPQIDPKRVEVCPNSIEVADMSVTPEVRTQLREKYAIPQDKKVFVYGGNLGKPQGVPFLMKCLDAQKNNENAYFLIVGDGTEHKKLAAWFEENKPENAKLLNRLPKEDYDRLVAACDVGLIFLDHRFTIPNFPSRLLSYMQAKLPVLCCTDPNTDVGQVCVDGGFGWWCESNDPAAFDAQVQSALASDLLTMGQNGFDYLNEHYTASKGCEIILAATPVK